MSRSNFTWSVWYHLNTKCSAMSCWEQVAFRRDDADDDGIGFVLDQLAGLE